MTGWVALGLEAAGRNPASFCVGGHSALGYLRSHIGSGTGDLERSILALEGAGQGTGRLVASLRSRRSGNGSFSGQVNLTAFGIMALRAAGSTAGNGRSADWLRGAQNDDGGWGFNPSAPSDPDSTGAALQGLRAGGATGSAIRRGVGYLRDVQRSSGGFSLRNGPVNSQSTAWAVQGLIAAGVNPRSVRSGGRSPLDYLRSRQAGNGHYTYSASSDQTPVWVTAQVLAAVSGRAFPLPAANGGRCAISSRPAPGTEGGKGRKGRDREGDKAAARGASATSDDAAVAVEPTVITTDAGSTGEEVLGGALTALAAAGGGGWLWWWRRRTGIALWPPNFH
jgi:energy-coupling factor transport system substrate-specific component